jgi:regulator of replication initiation timing
MNEKENKMSTSKPRGSGSAIVIFLAILALLLAVGGAVLLRQLLSARYEAQVMVKEVETLTTEKDNLFRQLDELEVKYAELSIKHKEMEDLFNAERRRVNQLRAQLRGEGMGEGSEALIAQYKQRIQELEEQLEAYRLQVEAMQAENQAMASENAQIRSTLSQTTARNTVLEKENQELEEQLEKAGMLTISNLEGTALRERRRGDENTTKAKRTDKLRICFTINQNMVAVPGNRDYYIRLVDPANQVLTLSPDNTIEFEGETIQYTIKRTVSYQNNAQEVCMVWTQDEKYQKGYYNVVVFSEGREVGYKLFQLE